MLRRILADQVFDLGRVAAVAVSGRVAVAGVRSRGLLA